MVKTNYCSPGFTVLLTSSNGHFYIRAGVMIRGNDKNHTFKTSMSEMGAMCIDIFSLTHAISNHFFTIFPALVVDLHCYCEHVLSTQHLLLLNIDCLCWVTVTMDTVADGSATFIWSLGGFKQFLHSTFTGPRGNCWPAACVTELHHSIEGCFSTILNTIDQPVYTLTIDSICPGRTRFPDSRWKDDKQFSRKSDLFAWKDRSSWSNEFHCNYRSGKWLKRFRITMISSNGEIWRASLIEK